MRTSLGCVQASGLPLTPAVEIAEAIVPAMVKYGPHMLCLCMGVMLESFPDLADVAAELLKLARKINDRLPTDDENMSFDEAADLLEATVELEAIEFALAECKHSHAQSDLPWCNVCGAYRSTDGQWTRPHVRDLLAGAIKR